MERDKLYTINKGNKPIFAQGVDRVNHNIFDGEFGSYMNNAYNSQIGSPLFRNNSTANPFGVALSAPTSSPYINWSSPSQRLLALWQTQTLANSVGNSNFDLNKSNQQLSNQITANAGNNKWNDDLTNAVAAGIGTVGTMAGNAIGKGYESSAADAFGTVASAGLGIAGTALFGPVGGAIGSAVGSVLGGAAHKLIGMKTDQEALSKAKAGTSYYNNFKSNAATFDAVQGPQTQLAITNPYKGGLLKKGKAKRMNNALRKDRAEAFEHAFGEVDNNVGNLVNDQMNNLLSESFAFGGALDLMQSNNYIDAINNRSNAIARNNMQPYSSPSLFGPRELYSCGGQIKPNKYEFGGLEASFVDNFAKDPLAAVLDYNRGIEQRAAAKEASEAAAAQEAMMNELKLGLQKAQAENEGLWAMYGDQQKALDALNDWRLNYMPAESASSTIEETTSAPATEAPVSVVTPIEPLSFTPQAPSKRYIYDELPELLRKAGLNIRVTSGYRSPASQKRFKTTNSWHPRHGAVDIVPQGKTTFEDIERVVVSNPEIRNYMLSNGYGFLDETNRTAAGKALMQKTGASGNHFHFGKDTSARNRYRKLVGMKAFGGELGTNGSDFTNGLLEINAGGSHEDNPFEGVQLGVDQNGVPNLVEEGETVFNDYVFSKRMVVPDFMKKQLGLGSAKDDITFADASKKIAQESVERPNDPISQAGLEAGLAKLAEIQETERMRMQAEQENADMEMSMMQGLSAYGGNLFATGGPKGKGKTYNKTANEKSILERLANSIGLGEITSSSGVQKVLNELGFDKATIRRMQSDLVNLGILPEGGENGEQIGVVPFANRGRVGRVGNVGRAANVAKREMAASKLASRGQMPKNTPKTGRPRVVAETSTPRSTVQQQVRGGDVPAGWRVGRGNVEGSVADIGRGTRTALNVRPTVVGRGNVPSVLTPTPTAGAVATAKGLLGATGALTGLGLYDAISSYHPTYTSEMTPYGGLQGVFEARNNRAATNNNQTVADAEVSTPVAETADSASTKVPVEVETPTGKVVVDVPVTPRNTSPTTIPTTTQTPETPYLYKEGAAGIPWNTQVETPQQRSPMEVIAENKGTTVTKNGTDFAPPSISTNSQGVIDSGEGTGIIDTESTDSADITEKQPKPYQTWMRYAPIVGTGIATMTDLLGLTNKDDFSDANKIEALAERAGYAPNIRAPYIGDYMRDIPFDRLFYANQLQANSRATDRGLMNTSGGNRGAAQAGMLANGYNSQLGLGNLYRQAEEYNRGQYERTKAFNRGTNQFNAQMGLEADMANARYRQMASQYQMQGLGQAAAMRQAEKAKNSAAKSANFTKLLNNLGYLGAENFALNQILSSRDANNGYYTDNKGIVYHNGKAYAEVKNPSAFGGEVERYLKNKKKVRRSK